MTISFSDIASIATAFGTILAAFGVYFAAWQIDLSKKQAMTAFEDSLAKEYRELAARLPTKALLGEPLTEDEYASSFDAMYCYLDLCNQQVFLKKKKRISKDTWQFWEEGITTNLKRPAFERAWSEVAARAKDDFTELRAIVRPKSIG